MKVFTVVGARPQFIKAAALSREIINHSNIEEIIVHTGQHYDPRMSSIFFEQMSIPKPKYNLNINQGLHGEMTGLMMAEIEKLLLEEKPDYVLVYGDTNSTLAAALAAAKLRIPIAHVESGLRSFNMEMPEEINRILTDRLSTLLFCPTATAITNLAHEGIPDLNTKHSIKCIVKNTGDIMFDAVKLFSNSDAAGNSVLRLLHSNRSNILITLHRQENVDNEIKLRNIFIAMEAIAKNHKVNFIFPIHPRTQKRVKQFNIATTVQFTEPMGYLELLKTLEKVDLVMTDSGGLQKEAYFLGKPSLILREQTEWVELVQQEVAFLCGSDTELIISNFSKARQVSVKEQPLLFGDGYASKKIISALS